MPVPHASDVDPKTLPGSISRAEQPLVIQGFLSLTKSGHTMERCPGAPESAEPGEAVLPCNFTADGINVKVDPARG